MKSKEFVGSIKVVHRQLKSMEVEQKEAVESAYSRVNKLNALKGDLNKKILEHQNLLKHSSTKSQPYEAILQTEVKIKLTEKELADLNPQIKDAELTLKEQISAYKAACESINE